MYSQLELDSDNLINIILLFNQNGFVIYVANRFFLFNIGTIELSSYFKQNKLRIWVSIGRTLPVTFLIQCKY